MNGTVIYTCGFGPLTDDDKRTLQRILDGEQSENSGTGRTLDPVKRSGLSGAHISHDQRYAFRLYCAAVRNRCRLTPNWSRY